jgi:hypothetical protein
MIGSRAKLTYTDFSLDTTGDNLDFLPLPLRITHCMIGSVEIEFYYGHFLGRNNMKEKNKVSLKRIFLNLETTDPTNWQEE